MIEMIGYAGAGAGKGERLIAKVQQLLAEQQIAYRLHLTEYAMHATLLARQIETVNPVIVVGGDGTLHEVVDGLYKRANRPPILYIPAGTGNDFARAWQKGRTLEQAIACLRHKAPQQVPLLIVNSETTSTQTVALNSMGFGFDGTVNYFAKQLPLNRWLSRVRLSKLSYFTAIFASIPHLKSFTAEVTIGEDTQVISQCALICLMNHPYLGGGIQLDNLGRVGSKEIVMMGFHSVTFGALWRLIWQVLVKKNQDQSPHVIRQTGKEMSIRVTPAVRGQIDGEILSDTSDTSETYHLTLGEYPFLMENTGDIN